MTGSAGSKTPDLEDPAFETLWTHVVAHWEDDMAHVALLEHCHAHDQLVAAAKRYRGLSQSVTHQAQATRRLNAIAVMALASMERSRSGPVGAKRQAGRLVALIFLVATVTGLLISYGLR